MTKEEIIALVNKGRVTQTGLVEGCSCADDKEFYATHVTQTGVAGKDLAEPQTPEPTEPEIPVVPEPTPIPDPEPEVPVDPIPEIPEDEEVVTGVAETPTRKSRSKKSDAPSVAPEA